MHQNRHQILLFVRLSFHAESAVLSVLGNQRPYAEQEFVLLRYLMIASKLIFKLLADVRFRLSQCRGGQKRQSLFGCGAAVFYLAVGAIGLSQRQQPKGHRLVAGGHCAL